MSTSSSSPELTVSLAPPSHPALAALRELELRFAMYDNDPNVVTFSVAGDNGSFSLLCLHDVERELLCLHASYPVRAHAAAVAETLKLLNELNRSLPGGGFRLDPEDGEITFRHTVHLGNEGKLDVPAFRSAIQLVRFALDEALPPIAEVAYAFTTEGAAGAAGADAAHRNN